MSQDLLESSAKAQAANIDAQAVNIIVKPAGLGKPLTYWLGESLVAKPNLPAIQQGSMVQVPLKGRLEQGWLVELGVAPPAAIKLLEIKAILGLGPSKEIMDLADWAAWRWQTSRAVFYQLASPTRRVLQLPSPMPQSPPAGANGSTKLAGLFERQQPAIVLLPPTAENWSLIQAAMSSGNALVILPHMWRAERLVTFARNRGHNCVLWPAQWEAAAAGGCSVVGDRKAVFASMPKLSSILMLDEHSDNYKETWRQSSWHARDVAFERAARLQVPLVLASPMPSLAAQQKAEIVSQPQTSTPRRTRTARTPQQKAEIVSQSQTQPQNQWPQVLLSDLRERRQVGLFSQELTAALADANKAICVLNRTGRVRLLACSQCGNLLLCSNCGGKLEQTQPASEGANAANAQLLSCSRCQAEAPRQCSSCHSLKIKNLRLGVKQAAEHLSQLLREPVGEITAKDRSSLHNRVLLGTTAVLQSLEKCDLAAFLEFDQLLLLPHFRAEEKALAVLAEAARLVGQDGVILLQTRQPENPVIQAAMTGDPSQFSQADLALRQELGLPPVVATALLSGPDAPAYAQSLTETAGNAPETDPAELSPPDKLSQFSKASVQGPDRESNWLLRAPSHEILLGLLESVPREALAVQVRIDPADF